MIVEDDDGNTVSFRSGNVRVNGIAEEEMDRDIRDYGMGDIGEVCGVPEAKPIEEKDKAKLGTCPNCGCKSVMQIEVPVKNKMLKGGRGIALYFGCPACPWASPAMARATP